MKRPTYETAGDYAPAVALLCTAVAYLVMAGKAAEHSLPAAVLLAVVAVVYAALGAELVRFLRRLYRLRADAARERE